MRIGSWLRFSIDMDDLFIKSVVKHSLKNIINRDGMRLKRASSVSVRVGSNGDDTVQNMITAVVEAEYYRIPRIIKK